MNNFGKTYFFFKIIFIFFFWLIQADNLLPPVTLFNYNKSLGLV